MKENIKKPRVLLELIVVFGLVIFVVYNIAYAIGKYQANKENKSALLKK